MTPIAARIALARGWRRAALAFFAGVAMALAQPPVSFPVVLFLAVPLLFQLVRGAGRAGAGFGIGWAAGAGYFATGLFWIIEPFMIDPERHGWMAPFALVGMAGGLALFWGTAFGLATLSRRQGPALAVILAALWTLAEYARSHVLTGFPWALVGYSWIDTPVMQIVSVIGPHGLGFLTVLAALVVGARPLAGSALALAVVAGLWGFGIVRLERPLPERAEPLNVRLVQPNAAQELKWRPDMQQVFFDRLLASTRAVSDPLPDVTIWPEAAVPFVLGYADDLQAEAAAAADPGTALILGIRRLDATPEREEWYNSLAVLRADGSAEVVYDKHLLVPFGEYIPGADVIARLGLPALTTLTRGGFSAGRGPHLVSARGLPPFLPLICYEAIFPHLMTAPEGRAEWIVHVTNDGWFGEASGPWQHLAQARSRSIEQGLPMARAANTGISAMIGPRGEVTARLGLGEQGHINALLPATLPATIYSQYGDVPALAAILVIFALTYVKLYSGVFGRPGS